MWNKFLDWLKSLTPEESSKLKRAKSASPVQSFEDLVEEDEQETTYTEEDLKKLKKEELLSLGKELELSVLTKDTKKVLIEKILESQG